MVSIALVTGPSSGIGRATAIELAKLGLHVIAAGRSEERTGVVVDAINSLGGSAEFLHLDLSSLDSARGAARRFVESGRRLDVLVNNAGVGGTRGETEDGFEIHFGVNHLGHFMLTHHLGPALHQHSRIVVVSSEAHRRATGIDFDRVQHRSRAIGGLADYATSKLANILFARHLPLATPARNTYSLHPGVVDTNIFPPFTRFLFRGRITPEEGAMTSVWCATSPDVTDETGLYYSRQEVREPSATAGDEALAAELWARSAQWCGIDPPR
jgi:NAD(P)-dependent dehydrogenase (short-subunit alcohol dehydrogenase family)